LRAQFIGLFFGTTQAEKNRLGAAFIVTGGLDQPPKMGNCPAFITSAFFNMPDLYRGRGKDKPVHPEKYRSTDKVSQDRGPEPRAHPPDYQPQYRGA